MLHISPRAEITRLIAPCTLSWFKQRGTGLQRRPSSNASSSRGGPQCSADTFYGSRSRCFQGTPDTARRKAPTHRASAWRCWPRERAVSGRIRVRRGVWPGGGDGSDAGSTAASVAGLIPGGGRRMPSERLQQRDGRRWETGHRAGRCG